MNNINNMNVEGDFDDLMEQAFMLPNGRAKVEMLEQAIQLADATGDIDQGYEARAELVECGVFNGYPLKALVAFSWQLGQFDKEPERFDEFSLFWSYKWILDQAPNFPDITRTQIDQLLEDMKQRFQQYGYSDRTYYFYKMVTANEMGEVEVAADYMKRVQTMERDDMSDCEACEQNRMVECAVKQGDDEAIIEAAKPIIDGGMSCGEVPHVTITKVLFPLLRLGRQKEADKLQRRGYRLVKANRDFLLYHGEHIGYLTRTDPIKALEVFEEHISMALDHENPFHVMMFNAYAAKMFERLAEESLDYQVKLPAEFPHREEAGNVAWLGKYFMDQALTAAGKFDLRNGNNYYSDFIRKI